MEQKEKPKKKVLFLRVNEEVHTLLKTSASMCGIDLQKWILRAAMEQVRKEKLYE